MKHELRVFALLFAIVLLLQAVFPQTIFADEQSDSGSSDVEETQSNPAEQEEQGEQETLAPPEEQEQPVPVLSDEELAEKYGIPDNWAREALLFAVRNGILCGKEDGKLHGGDLISRAEIAAILSRVFPTAERADLSGFSDVSPDYWGYDALGGACAMGILSGTEEGLLKPAASAAREQAFSMLARVFGYTGGNRETLLAFSDGPLVSNWAFSAVAAMTEAGYISGTDGKLNPKSTVTRQEFAAVLYRMITEIHPDAVSGELQGRIVSYCPYIPAGTEIDGDLLLCCDDAEITLNQLRVSGRLVLQGVLPLELNVRDCAVGELVLCRPCSVSVSDSELSVCVLQAAALTGAYGSVSVFADTTLSGTADCVSVYGADFTLETGTVKSLLADCLSDGRRIIIDGTVESAVISGAANISGSGMIDILSLCHNDAQCFCKVNSVYVKPYPGLESLELVRTDNAVPSADAPVQTLSVKFGGDVPGDCCSVAWYLDGKYVGLQRNTTLLEPQLMALDFTGKFTRKTTHTVTVQVFMNNLERQFSFDVSVQLDISKITAKRTDSSIPSASAPVKIVTVKFGGEVPEEPCDVKWYLDGTYVGVQRGVSLRQVQSQSLDFTGKFTDTAKHTVMLQLLINNQKRQFSFDVSVRLDLSKIALTRTDSNVPSTDSRAKYISVLLGGTVPSEPCTVKWYVNGSLAATGENKTRISGTTLSRKLTFDTDYKKGSPVPVKVVLDFGGTEKSFSFSVPVKKDISELLAEVAKIRTLKVSGYVRNRTPLYQYNNNTGFIRYIEAGTWVFYDRYNETRSAHVYTPEFEGWIPYYSVEIDNSAKFYVDWDYSKEAKEYWVNKQGYSSNTGWLVWANLYTQKVNVFTGSKGNWKLVKCFPCASGSNRTPTLTQVTTIRYKTSRWNFGYYGTDGKFYLNYYVVNVSVLDTAGRAFHSILYRPDGGIYDNTMSRPVSHGCLRMPPADCGYIYDNVPVDTTVILW